MGRQRAVLIGADVCRPDPTIGTLKYAGADATALYDVLVDADIGMFDEADVDLFVGENATWDAIKNRLRELAMGATASDVLLVYFAGHSLVPNWTTQPDAYLVTTDLDTAELAGKPDNGLRMAFLQHDVFRACKGMTILILDCCRAGIYADAMVRSMDGVQHYRPQVERHSALLACQKDGMARETDGLRHGVFTDALLRGLRGGAAGTQGLVTFGLLADFVARQGIVPQPGQFSHNFGDAVTLTRPTAFGPGPADLPAATASEIEPCKNPLDDMAGSVLQLLHLLFHAEPFTTPYRELITSQGLESIRTALNAASVAVVAPSRSGITPVTSSGHFDQDGLRALLEYGTAEVAMGRQTSAGYVVQDGRHRVLCVPVSYPSDATSLLTVVDPALALLNMGEPLPVMLRALWRADRARDPVQAELEVLTALRRTFGRLPADLERYAFGLYRNLIGSLTMVFQPVMSLGRRPNAVGIHSYEALARRQASDRGAPFTALQMAHTWGDRFVIERDALLFGKAVTTYAEADARASWRDGTKPLSINVAVRSLLSDDYTARIRGHLKDADLDPRAVALEISERDNIEAEQDEVWPGDPLAYFHRRLTHLARNLEIGFAVDDFGVGYSSLSRMAELRLTQIKVDRAVLHHDQAAEELRLVVEVAHHASDNGRAPSPRTVIVEGFDEESPVTLQQLYGLRIRHVQGYICGDTSTTTLHPMEQTLRDRIAALVRGEHV